ncbi:LuxR C-terminal-related transcriptional regulator [Pimelobacter simplex]|uniref:LuxR C-terminal-related transcriptional regulator n=1 Tax=Nocardioides simplex TaxID=2045 RepID=UPI00215019BA|nr:response regulator transcription factor [Pimelobacter simplex]UUW90510.1 response regulator transcription factor [Pimelobacter simplex]UUW94340.1 response regulator transcription factor [Pimelobacter simplex]
MGTSTAPRLAIIDHHVLFAEAVGLALQAQGYAVRLVDVGDPRASTATVLNQAVRGGTQVALLDRWLGPFGDGLRLVGPLRAAGVRVLVLTGSPDRACWGECLRHGAAGVVPKSWPLDRVLASVHRVSGGQPLIPAAERAALVELARREDAETGEIRRRLARLTPREAAVLGALMRGDPVGEIARAGVVSPATVRSQVKSILAKLELCSQIAAVGAAHRVGWRVPAAG